eukprot:GHVU01209057.1.p4 GENE.GHVU01209057.1~~GHVU01209057.1.p4  ORF type:complete len:103 (+),score=39.06 GHVU01209057.1:675-983(+)
MNDDRRDPHWKEQLERIRSGEAEGREGGEGGGGERGGGEREEQDEEEREERKEREEREEIDGASGTRLEKAGEDRPSPPPDGQPLGARSRHPPMCVVLETRI